MRLTGFLYKVYFAVPDAKMFPPEGDMSTYVLADDVQHALNLLEGSHPGRIVTALFLQDNSGIGGLSTITLITKEGE
jgi:hypothetical protein